MICILVKVILVTVMLVSVILMTVMLVKVMSVTVMLAIVFQVEKGDKTITDIFLSPMFDCGKTCYYPLQYPQSTLLHIQEIDKALPWFMVLSTR